MRHLQVLDTIHLNPFNTSKFGWIDSNLNDNGTKVCENNFDNLLLYNLKHAPNKFHIQILNVQDKKYKLPEKTKEKHKHLPEKTKEKHKHLPEKIEKHKEKVIDELSVINQQLLLNPTNTIQYEYLDLLNTSNTPVIKTQTFNQKIIKIEEIVYSNYNSAGGGSTKYGRTVVLKLIYADNSKADFKIIKNTRSNCIISGLNINKN